MEVSSLLSNDSTYYTRSSEPNKPASQPPQTLANGFGSHRAQLREDAKPTHLPNSFGINKPIYPKTMDVMNPVSPTTLKQSAATPPKKVSFELLLDETTKTRARIPMRVVINPHDTTDSIIATVKNWYGIYEGHGVSFEDVHGNTLIARYENVVHDMVIYVRIIPGQPYPSSAPPYTQQYGAILPEPQRRLSLGEPFQMPPPHHTLDHSQGPSRPASRLARKRSASPLNAGRGRSISQQKRGSRSELRSRNSSSHGSHHDDAMHGYSDSDGGQSSVTGSRKARSEQFASAEISLENVLQDGRRNRPKFDSSELPLFVPPQVPLTTSQSSLSPQRRTGGPTAPSPFALPSQKLFQHNFQALPSPQRSNEEGRVARQHNRGPQLTTNAPQHGHRLRDRRSAQPAPCSRAGNTGQGILPTPDPTVASCISDEDVARQLIALGDASNFSLGRTSASTLDDAFSGVADVASSTGATSDSDEYSDHDVDLPNPRRARTYSTDDGADEDYHHEKIIKSEEFDGSDGPPKAKKIKTKMFDGSAQETRPKSSIARSGPTTKNRANTLPKLPKSSGHPVLMKAPSAPAGSPVRKTSASMLNFQHQLAADEEDLSSKPRCQRCRKSKKGCDRQRPCQRCKDAGIGVDGCISEDEGNGRKGRYGRHMGVVVKKSAEELADEDNIRTAGAILPGPASAEAGSDKSKKRKR